MRTPNTGKQTISSDPDWEFLAEYPLSIPAAGGAIERDMPDGMLFQALQDLGLPAECLRRLERTFVNFAQEAKGQDRRGKLERSVFIRLFCQKKTIENDEPALIGNGGWGYFLIEPGDDFRPVSSGNSGNRIDLYVYKEGRDFERIVKQE